MLVVKATTQGFRRFGPEIPDLSDRNKNVTPFNKSDFNKKLSLKNPNLGT